MSNNPSIFTRIISRELPADIVLETEEIIAIKSIEPQAPVHLLVIPKREIQSMHELTSSPENQELLWKLFEVCRQLAEEQGIAESGYRLVTNVGPDAGQSVLHLHIHLLGGGRIESGGL